MRPPSEVAEAQQRAPSRRRYRWVIVAVIGVIVVIALLRTFAFFYTDALWFSSVHLHSVWRSLFEIKVELLLGFAALFAAALLASLLLVDRFAPKGPATDAEDDFVKRYQEVIGPYARWLRAAVVVGLALLLGSQAIGQWNNWLLYRNGGSFGVTDPQFGKDVGYFVFKLPFENFLVHWSLVSLFVILAVTVVAHYLNGGIRLQGPRPRVRPAVKAHLSVILGLIALVKAVGYYLARYSLDLSSNGFNQGADYTDVHARIPALQLLILVSLASAALLIYNIRRKGWALPIVGVGLWAVIALTAGAIYPAVVQALKVNPAQNTLERPYIQRNIDATREAYGLNDVKTTSYPATSTLTANQLTANGDTLNNVRLWDPSQTAATYAKLQDFHGYYRFNSLSLDRYDVSGMETPVVVGVREVNSSALPQTSWINTHLQYTHGYGMIVSPANQATSAGDPIFDIGDVPPVSNGGLPQITQPAVYYGLDNSGYVVADTKQPEIDYQLANGTNVETHYTGAGGVQLSSFFRKAMFALRFNDPNLVLSDQLTGQSRLMFDRGVKDMVSKAAPFLSLDSDPYPVLVDGQINWIENAYTTTDDYPYSENANTEAVSSKSGLPSTFNYVRSSVTVVVNAYTGDMTFYVMDPDDPIIKAYEQAFPGMFTPGSKMSPALAAHLRYPQDVFTVQATMYGKYHITTASSFYSAADAWVLSPSPGSGSPSQATATIQTTNAQGQKVSTGQLVRMSPIYQELRVPGQTKQSFTLLDAFVPVSQSNQIQTLSGFLTAGSDPGDYGKLEMFVTPRDQPVNGPALVAATIDANADISKEISYLNQQGSNVLLGNVLMIPVANSLLYVQPLYVQSSRNSVPELQEVIAVYGKNAGYGDTLGQALLNVFKAPVSTSPSTGAGSVSPQIQSLLADAQAAYQQSLSDLKAGNLGAYQNDIAAMATDLQQISELTGVPTVTPSTTPSAGAGSSGAGSSGAAGSAGAGSGPAGAAGSGSAGSGSGATTTTAPKARSSKGGSSTSATTAPAATATTTPAAATNGSGASGSGSTGAATPSASPTTTAPA